MPQLSQEHLAELEQPVEDIERELAKLNAKLEEASQRHVNVGALCLRIDRAEERLARARQRGACAAGKWCRGVGGAGLEVLKLKDDELAQLVCEVYCPCPAGAARQQADHAARVAFRKRQGDAHVGEWLEQLPPAFAAFRTHGFDTLSIESDAQRGVFDHVRCWAENSRARPWLYLCGPVGTGKTSLALAVARSLVFDGWPDVQLVDVPGLLSRIRRTYGKGADETAAEVMEELQTASVLVLDDLGVERITDWVTEQLFALINYRYGVSGDSTSKSLTIVTSNYDLAGLAQHVGGVPGERLAWRIAERAEVISLEDCPNLRLPKAKPVPQSGAQGGRPGRLVKAPPRAPAKGGVTEEFVGADKTTGNTYPADDTHSEKDNGHVSPSARGQRDADKSPADKPFADERVGVEAS